MQLTLSKLLLLYQAVFLWLTELNWLANWIAVSLQRSLSAHHEVSFLWAGGSNQSLNTHHKCVLQFQSHNSQVCTTAMRPIHIQWFAETGYSDRFPDFTQSLQANFFKLLTDLNYSLLSITLYTYICIYWSLSYLTTLIQLEGTLRRITRKGDSE
jgi:hypothetical protein